MKLKFFFPFLALMLVSNVFISCSDDNDGGNSDNDDDDSSIVISSTDALMLEDFIWDDMEPSVTRASADEDFPEMKFLAYFQNNAQPQEDRTYDVGVALYNAEKERVCTYQLYDSVYFTYGNPYKMDDKIIISKEINDGVYQLRPICKINGEEEWEDMKMADELSLIITISGNQAQLTKAFDEVEGSMEVKNLYIEQEKVYPNEEFKVTLDIFSNSTKSSIPVFLAQQYADGGYQKLAGEIWKANSKGEGTITLSCYAPSSAGTHEYYILSPLNDEPIAEVTIVVKGQTYNIEIDNIADEIEYILDDNSIEGTLTVQNYDEITFNQEIYAMLLSIDMNDYSIIIDSLFEDTQKHQLINLSIPKFGDSTTYFKFDNLNYDSYYAVVYGIKDENGIFMFMDEETMISLYTTPSAPSSSAEKEVKKRMAKASSLSFTNSILINGKKASLIKK